MDNILEVLKEIKLPFAYDHFAEGEAVDPPFICYLSPEADNFSADGKAYFKVNQYHLEVYTDKKDIDLERRIEAVLDKHEIFYDRTEVWIEQEHLYEVLYYFELEA